jgi:hypothetical protein
MMEVYISSMFSTIDTMRKMTVEFEPFKEVKKSMEGTFEKVISYEIIDELRLDFDDYISVDLTEFTMKDGIDINESKVLGNLEVLGVLKSDKNRHICLVKMLDPEQRLDFFKKLDLLFARPNVFTKDKITLSFIGENENLVKFIDIVKEHIGTVVNLSFSKASFHKDDLLSLLTEKQRESMITAYRYGYYEYPRRIDSKGLAEKVDFSRPTLVEHLRKGEIRLISEIMKGYEKKFDEGK